MSVSSFLKDWAIVGKTLATGVVTSITSVMTTLGDMEYGGSGGARSRLPGNTSTTPKFLFSAGNGTNAAAPSWQPIPSSGFLAYYFQNTASDVATYYKSLPTPYATPSTLTSVGVTDLQVIRNFVTEPNVPGLNFIPAGVYEVNMHAAQTAGSKVTQLYAEIWEVSSIGVDIAKIATTGMTAILSGSTTDLFASIYLDTHYTLASTASRIDIRIIASCPGSGSAPTVTLSLGGSADSRVQLPSIVVDATSFVPYTGATTNLALGANTVAAANLPLVTAKGGLIVGTAANAASELAVGTNAFVLTADSTQATGVKWAAAASGGATVFTGLTDVPANYTSSGYKTVRVNAGATGLEFYGEQSISRTTYGQAAGVGTGTDNVHIGYNAGNATTTANSNVYMGRDAGLVQSTGTDNVNIGYRAGDTSTGTSTVLIGSRASVNAAGNGSGVGIGNFANVGANGVAIGKNASATGQFDVAIGDHASATGGNSLALGASASTTSAYTTVLGNGDSAEFPGEISFTTGGGYANGTGAGAQASKVFNFPMWGKTTNNTQTEIGLGQASDTPTAYIVLANQAVYALDIELVATRTDATGESAVWQILTGIRRNANAAATALLGTPVVNLIGDEGSAGTNWSVTVTADTTNGRPAIKVTGQNAKTIRWVANVRMTKLLNGN